MKKLIDWLMCKKKEPTTVKVEAPKVQYIPELDSKIKEVAKTLVSKYSGVEASGEYKRHAVLAELMKIFPEAEKRQLALAIELAMWDDHEYVL